MNVTRQELLCDSDDGTYGVCIAKYTGIVNRTLAETRRDAAAAGWGFMRVYKGRNGGRDYCPKHSGTTVVTVVPAPERSKPEPRAFTEAELLKAAKILRDEDINPKVQPIMGIKAVRDLWETERLGLIDARDLVFAVRDRDRN
ncbi:hypothetical protein [Fodinicola acaciae]|uniref:hypothetical protein n=1 Tax=Fodinicola acaciae TaxID=2681555 RepID=UPI0013D7D1E9|nr:hypothetical protein [Fodinicola acaciae]